MKDRMLPCQVNPELTCPINCPNRIKLLTLLGPINKELQARNIDIGDEESQYKNLVETIQELIATRGGPAPEVRSGCLIEQMGSSKKVQ